MREVELRGAAAQALVLLIAAVLWASWQPAALAAVAICYLAGWVVVNTAAQLGGKQPRQATRRCRGPR